MQQQNLLKHALASWIAKRQAIKVNLIGVTYSFAHAGHTEPEIPRSFYRKCTVKLTSELWTTKLALSLWLSADGTSAIGACK